VGNNTGGGIVPILVTAGECSLTRFYIAHKIRTFCVTGRKKKKKGVGLHSRNGQASLFLTNTPINISISQAEKAHTKL